MKMKYSSFVIFVALVLSALLLLIQARVAPLVKASTSPSNHFTEVYDFASDYSEYPDLRSIASFSTSVGGIGTNDDNIPLRGSTVLYVDADATGSATGLSWTDAFTNVQDALDVANTHGTSDYEIWVAEGVYYPDEDSDDDHPDDSHTESFCLNYNNVRLYGGFEGAETARDQRNWEAHITILSGDLMQDDINTDGNSIAETWTDIQGANAYHVLYLDGATHEAITPTTVIDGFIVTAGQADLSDPHQNGGGLYCHGRSSGNECNPTLTNVTFSGNQADFGAGGGMFNDGSSSGTSNPLLINVHFSGNQAGRGGGMFNEGSDSGTSSPTLIHVTFHNNQADWGGGGMYNSGAYGTSSPTLTDVTFSNNQTGNWGGGICNYGFSGSSSPTLTDVTFSGNHADNNGGGMCNHGSSGGTSSPELTNITFKGNWAGAGGGGVWNYALNGASSPTLINVLFSGNQAGLGGGGMHNYGGDGISSPTLTNVTFSGNWAGDNGGGMVNSGENGTSAPILTNCILWGNIAGASSSQVYNEFASPTANHSLIEGGCPADTTCNGNLLTVDPRFVAPIVATAAPTTSGDYRLQASSSAIDAGDNGVVTASTDLDGHPRRVDITRVPDTGNGTPPVVDLGAYEVSTLSDNAAELQVRVFLAGPMTYYPDHHPDPNTMPTGLQDLEDLLEMDFIPKTAPYCEDPRKVETIPRSIVDWVLVELRSTPDGPAVASRSAFLRNDGYVVGEDGVTPYLPFDVSSGAYYVVVKHRNHLPVMSAIPVTLTADDVATYDFTTGSDQSYGGSSGTVLLSNNMWGMTAGDANGDGAVNAQDQQVFHNNYGDLGYENADASLSSQVELAAYSLIWNNQNRQTAVPNGGLSACPVHLIAVLSFDNDLDVHTEDVIERFRAGTEANSDSVATLLVDGEEQGGDTHVYQVTAGVITSTDVFTFTGELNTADPDILGDFIVWARDQYTGHRDALSLVGHGVGPAPEIHAQTSQLDVLSTMPPLPIGRDFTPTDVTDGSYLSTSELGRALADATDGGADPVDLLFLDSCFEGNLDVLYEVHTAAEVFVASPNYAWAAFAYDRYLPNFTTTATAGEMAQAITEAYQSALDDTHPNGIFWVRGNDIESVADTVSSLGDALQDALDNDNDQLILEATLNSRFADTTLCQGDLELCPPDELIDLRSFATNLQMQFDGVDLAIYNAADDVLTSLASVHATYRSGTPWVKDDLTWPFIDPAPTIVAPLTRTLEADTVWLASIYTETAPLTAVWSPAPTRTVTISTPFAYTTDGRWDNFISAWYGPLTPTVGPLCHTMLPPVVVTDTDAFTLDVTPGLDSTRLNWEAIAHPDVADYALYVQRPDETTWALLDFVPLVQTSYQHLKLPSGVYAYFVAARNGAGDVVARSDEIAVDVGITGVNPAYGLNNVPTLIRLSGSGFEMPITVTVGSARLEDVIVVDTHTVRAVVPSGLMPGTYDVTVRTENAQNTAFDAYTSLASEDVDDLRSFASWLWTEPQTVRVRQSGSRVGLNVQRLGGKYTLDQVAVEFRVGGPQGSLLGRSLTNLLAPNSIESTGPVTWLPQSAGTYRLCAIIDPDNDVAESDETNNLICRTITVLPSSVDTVPPVVDDLEIANGASIATNLSATLDTSATDYPIPGASGMWGCKFVEFEYILGARRWVRTQESDWVDYAISHNDYPWSLMPIYGVRYMQAWCMDNRGNISLEPAVDVINLLPVDQNGYVAKNGVVFYRIYLEHDQPLTVRLTPVNGDPDLHVWGPEDQLWSSNNGAGSEDVVTFNASIAGTYQVEVHGFADAHYRLFFETNSMPLMHPLTTNAKSVPPTPAAPLDKWPLYFDVEPPIEFTPRVGAGLDLSAGYEQEAEPESVLTYTHTLMNTGATTDTISLDVMSLQDWDVSLLASDYPSEVVDFPLHFQLGTGMTETIVASLTVPADADRGIKGETIITATSGISPTVYVAVTDTTRVKSPHTIYLPLITAHRQ
jgi:hypothetical protein